MEINVIENTCNNDKSVVGVDVNGKRLFDDEMMISIGYKLLELVKIMDMTFAGFQDTYKMDSFLGEGQNGECWKLTNKQDGKDYALKITKLPKDSSQKNEIMAKNELLRSFGHDNIIQCFHFTAVTKESEG